jgi:adenosylcobinamide amidohydrolase
MQMQWEVLLQQPPFEVRRSGRYVVATLAAPCRVISTSVENGGQTDHVRYLVNHQSCEGAGHHYLHSLLDEIGHDGYHRKVCGDAFVPPEQTAMMGTAANMSYTVVHTETDLNVTITAVVTGGVETNATCAGDPARWRETDAGVEKIPAYAGTINTMLLIDVPLTPAALARAIVTMTEGKSAALQRLAVPSRQSVDLATGTGTDQYCVAVPLGTAKARAWAGPHMKLGESIGLAVRTATGEALRWQNGLEPSYTRGVCHALGRYAVTEATFIDDMAAYLGDEDLELLRKNSKAVLFDPLVGAAAHALAAVLDRVRHGTVPASVDRDAGVQLAATLAANVAAQPDRWPEFRARLHQHVAHDSKSLVLAALALGWSEKWRSR